MLRVALVALLATSACRISLEDGSGASPDGASGPKCTVNMTNPACLMADQNPAVSQTLSWIEANIFSQNCASTSCHSPPTPGGGIVLTAASHAKLVNVDSTLGPGRKLVVPGDVAKSYLMVILQHLPLAEADPSPAPEPRNKVYMPPNSPPICCQKLEAIERWIMAGAMSN